MPNKTLKLTLLLLSLFFFPIILSAQNEKCGFDRRLKLQLEKFKTPTDYLSEYSNHWERNDDAIASNNSANPDSIPVVVHVLHLGEPIGTGTNISDNQIRSAINNLNEAFSAKGRYTESINTRLKFALARYDFQGNDFSGIIRFNASNFTVLEDNYGTAGITLQNENAIKNISKFPEHAYFNIWIVHAIDSTDQGYQGFAYIPNTSLNNVHGPVILYNAFGYDPDNTQGYNLKPETKWNTTFIHEVGHTFGLYHTFEGSQGEICPKDRGCGPDLGDCCEDTPPHKRSFIDDCLGTVINSCTGNPLGDLSRNFMNYSNNECQILFTSAQASRLETFFDRVKSCLTNSIGLKGIPHDCPEDMVWPGDIDNNGQVDMTDWILSGSDEKNLVGLPRPNATTQWIGQPAPDWPIDTRTPNLNNKHKDANGDGFITQEDEWVVFNNLGSTRPSTTIPPKEGSFSFRFEIEDNTSNSLKVKVFLETRLTSIVGFVGIIISDSIYGLSQGDSNDIFIEKENKDFFGAKEINNSNFDSIPIITFFLPKGVQNNPDINIDDLLIRSVDIRQPRIIISESIGTDTIFSTYAMNESSLYTYESSQSLHRNNDNILLCATVKHADCNFFGSVELQSLNNEDLKFEWSTGNNSSKIEHLLPGQYSVTVTSSDQIDTLNYQIKNNAFNCIICPEALATLPRQISSKNRPLKNKLLLENNAIYYIIKEEKLKSNFYSTGASFLSNDGNCLQMPLKPSKVFLSKIEPEIINNSPVFSQNLSLKIFPNPLITKATIFYQLPKSSTVNLNIIDLQGRIIQPLINQKEQKKGEHQLKWDRSNIPKGMYLIQLQTEWEMKTTKMLILD